jgi:threonine dehydrogenase-like Zn-dependent dehydrogenase
VHRNWGVWADVDIVEGKYGRAPPGETRLVLGHESLGRVLNPGY